MPAIKTDDNNRAIPGQYYNPATGDYEKVTGSGGAADVKLAGSYVTEASAVVPSDAVDLVGGVTKGLYLGGTGNVRVTLEKGSVVTFTGLAGGLVHPIAVKRVHATGTTATAILAVY